MNLKNIKQGLITALSLTVLALWLTPAAAAPHQQEGDTMRFYDAWGVQPDGEGGLKPVRITHCDWPGNNCIIGPTIEGPCQ